MFRSEDWWVVYYRIFECLELSDLVPVFSKMKKKGRGTQIVLNGKICPKIWNVSILVLVHFGGICSYGPHFDA